MAFILTRPQNSGITGANLVPITIGAGNTEVVDSIPVSSGKAFKWIYNAGDSTANKSVSAEVMGQHIFGNNPSHNRYAVIGDKSLKHIVDVVINGSNIEFTITNNDVNDIDISAVRIQVI